MLRLPLRKRHTFSQTTSQSVHPAWKRGTDPVLRTRSGPGSRVRLGPRDRERRADVEAREAPPPEGSPTGSGHRTPLGAAGHENHRAGVRGEADLGLPRSSRSGSTTPNAPLDLARTRTPLGPPKRSRRGTDHPARSAIQHIVERCPTRCERCPCSPDFGNAVVPGTGGGAVRNVTRSHRRRSPGTAVVPAAGPGPEVDHVRQVLSRSDEPARLLRCAGPRSSALTPRAVVVTVVDYW